MPLGVIAARKIPSSRDRFTSNSAQCRASVRPAWKQAIKKMDPMFPSIPLFAVQPTLRTEVPAVHRAAFVEQASENWPVK